MPELSKRRQRQLILLVMTAIGRVETATIPCFISMNIRQKTWIGSGYLI